MTAIGRWTAAASGFALAALSVGTADAQVVDSTQAAPVLAASMTTAPMPPPWKDLHVEPFSDVPAAAVAPPAAPREGASKRDRRGRRRRAALPAEAADEPPEADAAEPQAPPWRVKPRLELLPPIHALWDPRWLPYPHGAHAFGGRTYFAEVTYILVPAEPYDGRRYLPAFPGEAAPQGYWGWGYGRRHRYR